MKLTIKAANNRLAQEHRNRAWVVWHIAALQRVKRIPPLRLLSQTNEPGTASGRPRQTWQEQFQVMQKWAAAHNRAVAIREQMSKVQGQ